MELNKVNWNELRDRAYQNAVKHGFYENTSLLDEVMMIVTELGEAVQADRDNKFANLLLFEKNFDTPQINPEEHYIHCYDVLMKDTVEDELADAFIRMLSFLAHSNIDMDADYFEEVPVNMMVSFMDEKNFTEQIYTIVHSFVGLEDFMCAFTRLIALAIIHDIDLIWHVEKKMKYNELRPYKHGKKY